MAEPARVEPLRTTLEGEAPSLARKCQDMTEVTKSDKHSSLL